MQLGKRLVCPEAESGGTDGASWVNLWKKSHEDPSAGPKIKGSLLLELVTTHNLPPAASKSPKASSQPPTSLAGAAATASAATVASQPGSAAGAGGGAGAAAGLAGPAGVEPEAEGDEDPPQRPTESEPAAAPALAAADAATASAPPASMPFACAEEASDSASDAGGGISGAASVTSASTSSTISARVEEAQTTERPLISMLMPPLSSGSGADLASLVSGQVCAATAGPTTWLPFGGKVARTVSEDFDCSALNIFTINNPTAGMGEGFGGAVGSAADSGSRALRHLLRLAQKPVAMKPFKEHLLSVLDPGVRQQRREVRKWRHWHTVFCTLNEIEQRLAEVLSLLLQAASSMGRFEESHSGLCDLVRLSAFLRDAALYYRSEAAVPKRVEAHLCELERVADEFRGISVEALPDADTPTSRGVSREGAEELRRACEDLQVDIAVLLESAMMTAQQALAEYKKMHCRLELLVTEYEPVCRIEMDAPRPASIFLPLLTDEGAKQAAAASMPEQAVQWALDFSQRVGAASRGLTGLVHELEQRVRQLRNCANELRSNTLRRASSSGQLEG